MFSTWNNNCVKSWKYWIISRKSFNNWEGINFPSKIEGWKIFEKNNSTIALNDLYIKGKEICPAYISKIFSMIRCIENEGWHFLVAKNYLMLSLSYICISKRKNLEKYSVFIVLILFHSFRIENKFKSHEKVCKNMDFCGVVMPSQKDNILQFNISSQITYHTLFMQKFNFWLKKTDGSEYNSDNLHQEKKVYIFLTDIQSLLYWLLIK